MNQDKPLDIRLREIATKDDFLHTYKIQSIGEKGLDFFGHYGIFPLTYQNSKLIFINILGL